MAFRKPLARHQFSRETATAEIRFTPGDEGLMGEQIYTMDLPRVARIMLFAPVVLLWRLTRAELTKCVLKVKKKSSFLSEIHLRLTLRAIRIAAIRLFECHHLKNGLSEMHRPRRTSAKESRGEAEPWAEKMMAMHVLATEAR